MAERRSEKHAPLPWRFAVAVEDVAETGERFELVADAEICAALARIAGLRELLRLQANFDVTRHGDAGLRVVGRVCAIVGQACVVTLEPLVNEVAEEIDLLFVPPAAAEPEGTETAAPGEDNEEAEPLIGGSIDLGALAAEFLLLGINPYPRKPGAVFAPPPDARPNEGPFAALAALKKGRDGR
ncbi:MAG: DUF177 domain-containing protein [Xanthobacteraceae bacterium]|nr:DUF177 domain-containing protein [Xanthobacteraceae bacterium]